MDISIFLAKFWGWYMITFFVLIMLYPKRIKQLFDFSSDDRFAIIISFMAIIIGLLNIIAHDLWVSDWRIIITLLGWLAFIKGITIFAFPDINKKWLENIDFKWFQFLIFLLFLMGIFLLNQAYVWVQI
jgi:hypothetical protein